MSRDRFRGYFHQQFNHQRLDMGLAGMPGIEKGVLLELTVLFGLSRQNFGLNDGRLCLSSSPAKVEELARWISTRTPGVSAARADKALLSLYKEFGQIEISKAGVVKMRLLASEQKDAPSAAAGRKRESRKHERMEKALLCLSKVNGKVLDADVIMFRLQGALRCKPKTAEGVLKDLAGQGVVVPADGGLMVDVPANTLASLASPPVSERPADGEGEVTCAHPDGCDMSQSLDHIISHDRFFESHDHDARAARGCEVPPEPAAAASGPRHRDGFADEGGGGERSERQSRPASPTGIDAIYACHWRNLPQTAVKLLGSSTPTKSVSIIESKIRRLCDHCGPQSGQDCFRQLVHEIHTEMNCPGGERLREPCMELCARINEAMGLPRRAARGQGAGRMEQGARR